MPAKQMTVERLVSLPMVDWQKMIGNLTQAERFDIEQQAAVIATRYARLSAYITRRQSGGKHEDAVKAQNRSARRVRQALGYTYADDSIAF